MDLIRRRLDIKLPARQSAFLWGPRKTGKSTYLKERFPDSTVFDFLQTDLFLEFSRRPSRLRERLAALPPAILERPVILDEVQKTPHILDEVHWLIENKGLSFILCGSSARKLKQSHANLLGGRAWRYEMFPLVTAELGRFELLRSLNHGMIPSHYLQDENGARQSLKAYLEDYLKQEVFAEGLTRNFPAFSRFFDTVGFSHAEIVNYSNIGRDCGIDSKTVKGYYQILTDTLIGSLLEPYKKRQDRQVLSKAPKFYLFDTGVAGSLTGRWLKETRGADFGKAFEHFIYNEINAWRSYSGSSLPIRYWRTKSGMEVDFILGQGEVAIEVKGSARVDENEFRALSAFTREYRPRKSLMVCNEPAARLRNGIEVLPWPEFLDLLWSGKLVSS